MTISVNFKNFIEEKNEDKDKIFPYDVTQLLRSIFAEILFPNKLTAYSNKQFLEIDILKDDNTIYKEFLRLAVQQGDKLVMTAYSLYRDS